MRNLMIIFLMMISFASIEAQITFESTEMVVMEDGKIETQKLNSKIIINSDTTEIELHLKNVNTKEKIYSLLTVFNEETHDVYVYRKENDEILVLYISNGNIYSVLFQSNMDNSIMFNL